MLEWNRDIMGPYEEFELLEDTEVVHKVPVKKRRPTSVVPTSADYLKPLKLHKKYAKKFDAKGYEDVESLREHVVEDEIDIDKMMAEFEMLPPHARKLLKSLEKKSISAAAKEEAAQKAAAAAAVAAQAAALASSPKKKKKKKKKSSGEKEART